MHTCQESQSVLRSRTFCIFNDTSHTRVFFFFGVPAVFNNISVPTTLINLQKKCVFVFIFQCISHACKPPSSRLGTALLGLHLCVGTCAHCRTARYLIYSALRSGDTPGSVRAVSRRFFFLFFSRQHTVFHIEWSQTRTVF